ncbi:hypothetical protein J5N97_019798 [Dioscorea zingiberensis]|uniref:Uncharacterized protein n=1 Tax=Dioscorea zingiberensis TaxID=325984 RepID=A0A9D5HCU2_9LILI|nr:hypothetical protein J5N97_019798 [Dioscorea zingiberensis]
MLLAFFWYVNVYNNYDDFGKDFLTSWKPSKGKNSIDFDAEAVPGNGKNSFNFDKLDAFELGGDYKISSFKMDMPDLDFSSPCKKDDKTKKPSKDSANKETKQDKFSFTFDFNELESFSLGSSLLKGDKQPRKCTDSGDCSSKSDGAQDSKSNSVKSVDAAENSAMRKSSTADNMATSPAEPAIKHDITNGSGPSTSSDPGRLNMSHEGRVLSEKQATIAEGSIGSYIEMLDRKCSTKQYAEKSARNILPPSSSSDATENKAFPESEIGSAPLDCLVMRKAQDEDNNVRSIDSSHSRSSSPANSYNSQCWLKTNTKKLSSISVEVENQHRNQDEACGGSEVGESNKGHKDENVSEMDATLKNPHENKLTGGKQNTSSKFLPSSLNTIISNKILKAKSTAALQFSSLNKLSKNVSQPTSVGISNQLYSRPDKKMETKILCHLNEKRESISNDEQAGNQASGKLKSFGKTVRQDVSVFNEGGTNIEVCDTSDPGIQVQPSNMSSQITASSNTKDINHISSILPIKSSITSSIEPKDEKRLTKLNITSANSTVRTETKSDKFSEGNFQSSHCTESKVANSIITGRNALLSPSLKRKAPEELKADTRISNQLKRFMVSSTERKKSLDASAQFGKKLVPGTESPGGLHKETVICNQNLSKNLEVPILIENDGNVEKAEACAKELDDICTMLKKKHEEAKELLVRAVVNNNALLMLNHPMFDEKISFHHP